jgi:hypothetical protein
MFAAHIAFACEGSVAQLRGLLARSLGRETLAREHLQVGLALCDRSGFATCAAQIRQALAQA